LHAVDTESGPEKLTYTVDVHPKLTRLGV
jgi:hypothetical protein